MSPSRQGLRFGLLLLMVSAAAGGCLLPPTSLSGESEGPGSPGVSSASFGLETGLLVRELKQRPPNWPSVATLAVDEWADSSAPSACPGQDCSLDIDSYLDLADRIADPDQDRQACRDGIRAWVDNLDLWQGTRPEGLPAWMMPKDLETLTALTESIPPSDLAREVLAALRLEPLLADFDGRTLEVVVRGESLVAVDPAAGESHDYWKRELVFNDPAVAGSFDARLLLPVVDEPVPAVVAMMGHPTLGSALDDFTDFMIGHYLASHGIAVLIISVRGMDSGSVEDEAVVELLCAGSSLYSMHIYESFLAAKYLRWLRPQGEVAGIGFVGHSSGSVWGNALFRIGEELFPGAFQAYVSDLTSSYLQIVDCPDSSALCLIDETTPQLYPWHWRINDENNPAHRVPMLSPRPCYAYNCPGDPERVLAFFQQHLTVD